MKDYLFRLYAESKAVPPVCIPFLYPFEVVKRGKKLPNELSPPTFFLSE